MNKTIEISQSFLCETLALLFSRLSPGEQYDWLRRNGGIICALELDECIVAMHKVSNDVDFNRIIDDFWSPNERMSREIDVETILNYIGETCYENHLEFSFNNLKDNMDLSLAMSTFRAAAPLRSYYSAPLFRAIIKIYGMTNSDTFIFTKARRGNDIFIVFNVRVDGELIDLNVNITDNPTFLPKTESLV